jgi:hypothetical protein
LETILLKEVNWQNQCVLDPIVSIPDLALYFTYDETMIDGTKSVSCCGYGYGYGYETTDEVKLNVFFCDAKSVSCGAKSVSCGAKSVSCGATDEVMKTCDGQTDDEVMMKTGNVCE